MNCLCQKASIPTYINQSFRLQNKLYKLKTYRHKFKGVFYHFDKQVQIRLANSITTHLRLTTRMFNLK